METLTKINKRIKELAGLRVRKTKIDLGLEEASNEDYSGIVDSIKSMEIQCSVKA
jgi:hypothetical protein